MGTTAEKLAKLIQTKSEIKQAIIDKGVSVSDNTPFGMYASKIAEIPTGGEFQDFLYGVQNKTLSYISTSLRTYASTTTSYSKFNNLSFVNMPQLEALSYVAFESCNNLTSVSFPKLEMWYGNAWFSSCPIQEMNLPELTTIRAQGTSYTIGYYLNYLTNFSAPKLSRVYRPFFTCNQYGTSGVNLTMSLPEMVHLPLYAFYNNANLTSLYAPKAVFYSCAGTQTPGQQFYGCSKLTDITLDWEHIDYIPCSAFANCSALTSLSFPAVTSIGQQAFYGCWSLSTFNAPLLSVYDFYDFYYCSKLSNLGNQSNTKTYRFYSLAGLPSQIRWNYSFSASNAYEFYNYCYELYSTGWWGGLSSRFNLPNLRFIRGVTGQLQEYKSGVSNYYVQNGSDSKYVLYSISSAFSTLSDRTLDLSGTTIMELLTNMSGSTSLVSAIVDTGGTLKTVMGDARRHYIMDVQDKSQTTTYPFAADMYGSLVNVSTINLPSARYIGPLAFYNVSALASLYAPNLQFIGDNNFYYIGAAYPPAVETFGNLKRISYDTDKYIAVSTATITSTDTIDFQNVHFVLGNMINASYSLSQLSSNVSNPYKATSSIINTENIKVVGDQAFMNNSAITTLSFPNLRYAGVRAFGGMTNLTSFYAPHLPDVDAFKWDTSNQDNMFAHALGQTCFRNCLKLSSCDINWSAIKIIPSWAFWNCYSLTGLPDLTNVRYIGESAFYNCYQISRIYAPNCEAVGSYAFTSMSNLQEVYLGKVKWLQNAASLFQNATSKIKRFELPEFTDMWSNGWMITGPVEYISMPKVQLIDKIISGTSKVLKYANFNDTQFLPTEAFYNQSMLSEVHVDNCESIGYNAFYRCSSLTSISLPKCKYIGPSAFVSCTGLTAMSLPELRSMGSSAFQYCSNLSLVYAPKLESVPDRCFSNTGITIVDTSTFGNNISTIGSGAFAYCSRLSYVSLSSPNYLDYIPFAYCSALTEVRLPNVKSIYTDSYTSSSPFSGCTNLSSLYMENLEVAPTSFVAQRYNLTTLSCPNIKKVYGYAFYYCSKLTTIDLKKTETFYGSYPFTGCLSLSMIYFNTSSVPTCVNTRPSDIAYGMNTSCYFYIPSSMWDAYMATSWAQISSKFVSY